MSRYNPVIKPIIPPAAKFFNSFPPDVKKHDVQQNPVAITDDASLWTSKSGVTTDLVNTFGGKSTVLFTKTNGSGSPYGTLSFTAKNLASADYIEVWMYLSAKPQFASNNYIRFYSGADYFQLAWYKYIEPNDTPIDKITGWRRIRLNKVDFTIGSGAPVWSNITGIGFILSSGSTADYKFNLAKIDAVTVSKPLVSIDFDDGLKSVYDLAYPIMDKYGLKGTSYIVTSTTQNGTTAKTWAQNRELQQAGWTIGNHTHGHLNLSTLTREEIQFQYDTSQKIMREHGFITGSYFLATPFSGWSLTAYEEAISRFIFVRSGRVLPNTDAIPLNDNLDAMHNTVHDVHTVEEVKAVIDSAIAKKTWLKLLFHGVGDTGGTYYYPTAKFEEVMAYIALKRDEGVIEVPTMEEALFQYSGVVSLSGNNHSVISNDDEGLVVLSLNR